MPTKTCRDLAGALIVSLSVLFTACIQQDEDLDAEVAHSDAEVAHSDAGVEHQVLAIYRDGPDSWNIASVNTETADVSILGLIDGLASTSTETLLSENEDILYVFGTDTDNQHSIFAFDVINNVTVDAIDWDPTQHGYNLYLLGFTEPTRMTCINQVGQIWQVISLELSTGDVEVLGPIPDMESWTGHAEMKPDNSAAYLFGNGHDGEKKIFAFDFASGLSTAVNHQAEPTWSNLVLVGFDTRDRLIGLNWNDTNEQVVHIDELTGQTHVLGLMGQLHTWESGAVLSPDRSTLFAFGDSARGEAPHQYEMYQFNLDDDVFVEAIPQDPSQARPLVVRRE